MGAPEVRHQVEATLGVRLPDSFERVYAKFEGALVRRVGASRRDELGTLFFLECAEEREQGHELAREGSSSEGWSVATVRRILERILQRARRDLKKQHQYLPLDLEPSVEPESRAFEELVEPLDEDATQLLVWYFLESYTLEEIASMSGSSRSTVHRKIQDATESLRLGHPGGGGEGAT